MNKEFKLSKVLGLKYISTLRNTILPQVLGAKSGANQAYCAVGLLAYVAGIPVDGNCYSKVRDLIGQDLMLKLFRLNDAERLSFKEIANWVEKNVELI